MSDKSLVSIIIPVFNRAHLIGQTLDSVISQSYNNWECVIVDDGSNDNTQKVVSTYLVKDSRFKFFNRPIERPKGANACRNYGFKMSKGEFINFLDSDDLLNEDFLRIKIKSLIDNESLDFCACINSTFKNDYTNIIAIDRPAIFQSTNYIEDYLLNGLYFFTSSPLWRRKFLKDKELFDETLHRSQERDFHFRMLTLNAKYTYLDKVLVYKRLEENSISAGAEKSIIAQKSVFKYFNGVFKFLKTNKNLKHREKLMAYIFYRQTTNYYNINQLCNGFMERFHIFISYKKTLYGYLFSTDKLKRHFFKIFMGLFVLLIFNKGYKYFYFPEYNYAKKDI